MASFGTLKDEVKLLKSDINMYKKQNVFLLKSNRDMKKELQTIEAKTEARVRMEVVREASRNNRKAIQKLEEVYGKKVEDWEDLGLSRDEQDGQAFGGMKKKMTDEVSKLKKVLADDREVGGVTKEVDKTMGEDKATHSYAPDLKKSADSFESTEPGPKMPKKEDCEKELEALRLDSLTKQKRIDELNCELDSYRRSIETKQTTIEELRDELETAKQNLANRKAAGTQPLVESTDNAVLNRRDSSHHKLKADSTELAWTETTKAIQRDYERKICELGKQVKDLNEHLTEASQRFIDDQDAIENLKTELEKLKPASSHGTTHTAVGETADRSLSPTVTSPTDFVDNPIEIEDSIVVEMMEDIQVPTFSDETKDHRHTLPTITVSRASSTGLASAFALPDPLRL